RTRAQHRIGIDPDVGTDAYPLRPVEPGAAVDLHACTHLGEAQRGDLVAVQETGLVHGLRPWAEGRAAHDRLRPRGMPMAQDAVRSIITGIAAATTQA